MKTHPDYKVLVVRQDRRYCRSKLHWFKATKPGVKWSYDPMNHVDFDLADREVSWLYDRWHRFRQTAGIRNFEFSHMQVRTWNK